MTDLSLAHHIGAILARDEGLESDSHLARTIS